MSFAFPCPRSHLLLAPLLVAALACASSTSGGSQPPGGGDGVLCAAPDGSAGNAGLDAAPASCPSPGRATPGPVDMHCRGDGGGLIVQKTSQASCCVAGDAGGPDTCGYGPTLFGTEADDDDCKYHVAWTASPLCEGPGGVEVTVVATSLSTHEPVTGAHIHPEVFTTTPGDAACDDRSSHESPSSFEVFGEGPPGTYKGRVVFDAPGAWTMRFHLFENCVDVLPDSPHGHAAFHLTLP